MIESDYVVQKALRKSERFGVILKTCIALLLSVSILTIFRQLEGISKTGGLIIIISNTFTTVLLWTVHLRRNPRAIYRYFIFILAILCVQLVVYMYSFASSSLPDYGIEHIGLIMTALGVIIAAGTVNCNQEDGEPYPGIDNQYQTEYQLKQGQAFCSGRPFKPSTGAG